MKMKEKLSCDGLNIVQNNGEAAGQTVQHFHMHLIPRYVNDGQKIYGHRERAHRKNWKRFVEQLQNNMVRV